VTGFSAAVRTTIRQRADGWCERCGLQRGRDHHHRRPRGAGGSKRDDTNVASNAGFLCGSCHEWCESHRTDAINEGWLVKQHQTPIDIPVLYRGAWCFLDDLGNLRRVEEVI
jgi:5-methylcytosine-specific restriction protein A